MFDAGVHCDYGIEHARVQIGIELNQNARILRVAHSGIHLNRKAAPLRKKAVMEITALHVLLWIASLLYDSNPLNGCDAVSFWATTSSTVGEPFRALAIDSFVAS